MKKLILFLLLFVMLISSTSFAQVRINREVNQKKVEAVVAANVVAENRVTIKALADKVREKTKLAKLRIKEAIVNEDQLSTQQLKVLKNSMIIIKENQEVIHNTLGQINAYNEDVKLARQGRDFEKLLELYNKIIDIQKIRIKQLKLFNEVLDDLLSVL